MRDNQTVILRGLLAFVPLFIACSGAPQPAAPVVGSIAGNAKFLDATAHAGIRVAVRGTDHVATTDNAGAFLIESVAPGSYAVEASASGYVTATTVVQVNEGARAQAALTLSREAATTGAISGRVTRSGAATGNAGIAIALLGTSWSASAADDGGFRIDGIAPGTYALQFSAPGFTNFVVSSVTVTAGNIVPVDTVALVRVQAGRVAGRVTRDGAATGNGGIAVFLEGTTALATTDDSGAFTLDGVMPGTYVLAASAPGFLFAEVPGVQVTDGVATQVAAVDLAPSVAGGSPVGDVEGTAGPLAASDSSGVSVALVASTGAIFAITTTDSAGAWLFHAVPLGTYSLRFTLAGYDPAEVSDVPVLPGAYQVPPVVLYPGASAGPPALGPGLALGADKLLVSFAGGNAVYDSATGALTPTLLAGKLTVLDVSSDGTHALVRSDQSFVRLDLQTGAYTFLATPSSIYGQFDGKWAYVDGFGNFFLVSADDATAPPPVSLGCTTSSVSFIVPLANDASPAGHWVQLEGGFCTPFPSTVLLDVTTGRVSLPSDVLGVVDGGGAALLLTRGAGSGGALVRFDLSTGAVTTLSQNAVTYFASADYRAVWGNPDANGLGTISRLNLHDGTLVDLLAAAPNPGVSVPQPIAILQGGTPLSYNVVRFDQGTSVALCPTATFGNVALFGTSFAYCTGAQLPVTIRTYDLSNGTLQTLTTAASNWLFPSGTKHVMAFRDTAWHVARTDIAGAQVSPCSGTFTPSQDESEVVALCGQAYVVDNVLQGTASTVFTAPAQSVTLAPVLSAQGRFVVGQYTMSSGNGACGQPTCAVVVDTTSGAQIQFVSPQSFLIGSVSTAPGDSAVFFSLSFNNYAVVRPSGAGLAVSFKADLAFSPSVLVWSRSGNCALLSDSTLLDVTTGVATGGGPGELNFIGTSETLAAGDAAADLATCAVTHLGTGIVELGRNASSVTYIDPASQELRRFTVGIGISTLLTAVQPIATVNGTFLAAGGSMYTVASDGSLRLIVSSAAPLIQQVGQYSIAFANSDGETGDAVLVDHSQQTVLPLGARVPLTGGYFYGVNGNRFVFAGTLPGDAVTRLLSTNLDGTGTRIVGSGTVTGLIGSRLLFQSPDGIEWVEGATAPLATDRSFTLVGLSPDGSSMLIDGSASHPGLYRVALP
ncbi:MAG TPA: carboxypeptidase-like regulatory domain-containing protein [Myxococcales bacterium]|jgi:hypothetical protein